MNTVIPTGWLVDSSTFIHFVIIERVRILVKRRRPLQMPEYVYRLELTGVRCAPVTLACAQEAVNHKQIQLETLTLADLERIAELGPRRSASLGELACAVIAERTNRGVLSDDRRARSWLAPRLTVPAWQSIELILIEAAHGLEVSESELDWCEQVLARSGYRCSPPPKMTFLMQRLSQQQRGPG